MFLLHAPSRKNSPRFSPCLRDTRQHALQLFSLQHLRYLDLPHCIAAAPWVCAHGVRIFVRNTLYSNTSAPSPLPHHAHVALFSPSPASLPIPLLSTGPHGSLLEREVPCSWVVAGLPQRRPCQTNASVSRAYILPPP